MLKEKYLEALEDILMDINFEYRNSDYPDSQEEHDIKVAALNKAMLLIIEHM